MKKYEYLHRLEQLLSALPQQERQDALNYYEEYFDAAGPEREDATAAELGSPEEVAEKILAESGLKPAATTAAPTKPKAWKIALAAVAVLLVLTLGVLAANGMGNTANRTGTQAAVSAGTETTQDAAPQNSAATDQTTEDPLQTTQDATGPSVKIDLGQGSIAVQGAAGDAGQTTQDATGPSVKIDLGQGSIAVQGAAETTGQTAPSGTTPDSYTETALPGFAAGQSVKIDLEKGSITVAVDADRSEPVLKLSHFAENEVRIDQKTNELTIESDTGRENAGVELLLPSGFALAELEIDNTAGTVDLTGLTVDTAQVESEAGEITLKDVQATRTIEVEALVGGVTVQNIRAPGGLTLENEVGAIKATLPGTAADYTFVGDSGMGTLEYDGTAYTGTHRQGTGPNPLAAETEVGTITIRFQP